eukprot:TRINITY_DN5403_c0_g1_i1.p3 TRINITY_DN5403_c0_g1~~TRINITY_DN5403_c0_g1_i1.p3  ORF type:complete len:157 (+),score=38.91 TRINITY_DN5403_c0_g1_i1:61-531(+)
MEAVRQLKSKYYQSDQEGELVHCTSLSFKQRVIGFAVCVGTGLVMSVLSWMTFGHWLAFGVLMTCGNLCSLAGTLFLVGPKRQAKMMFKKVRVVATIMFLVFMGLTLVAALVLRNGGLTALLCIGQYLALIWYGLSYIPYARTAVKKAFHGLVTSI